MHEKPNDEEWAAYLRIRDAINPAQPEVKLRGKTYEHRAVNVAIASRLIDLCRSDKIMYAMLMQSVQDSFTTPDSVEELSEKGDDLMAEALEKGMAKAITSLRRGFRGMDELELEFKHMARGQQRAHAEIQDSEDWDLIKDKFGVADIGSLTKEEEPKPDEGYHGGIYI